MDPEVVILNNLSGYSYAAVRCVCSETCWITKEQYEGKDEITCGRCGRKGKYDLSPSPRSPLTQRESEPQGESLPSPPTET